MKPLVSIIVPVYHAESSLRSCIDSILAQTCQDFELYLVDDGSDDNSGIICDEYASADLRIHVIHQNNQGVACARNTALDQVQGEWIAFVDADDRILPRFLETYIHAALAADADAVLFPYRRIAEKEGSAAEEEPVRGKTNISLTDGIWSKETVMLSLLDNRIGNFSWNKIYRKHLWSTVRYPAGRLYEDVAVIWKVLDNGRRFCFVSQALYEYRQCSQSISHQDSRASVTDDFEMRLPLWKHLCSTAASVTSGNEFFILAPALKYCTRIDRRENPPLWKEAYTLLMQASSVPAVFSARQKLMMRLLHCLPAFEQICRMSGKRFS